MARYDPAQRLPKEDEEVYAWERSCGFSIIESARNLGWNVDSGRASKYEARPRVQARIAHLRRQDVTDEMRAIKRERIERELEAIGYANMDDFVRIDGDGHPVLDLREIDKLSDIERRALMAAVKTVRYTEHGPAFEMHAKGEALAQLRDMHGFKAPSKVAATDPTGNTAAPFMVEIVRFSDAKDKAAA